MGENEKRPLGEWLTAERAARVSHGAYYWTSIVLAYNSNHIEGNALSQRQTQQLYDTQSFTLDGQGSPIHADDVIETRNHFRAFDLMLDRYKEPLSHDLLTSLHATLKAGTSQSLNPDMWNVGGYKTYPNLIGRFGDAVRTTPPDHVRGELDDLFAVMEEFTGTDAQFARFHATFESIHPFSDGNGRVGRLLMFKEGLRVGALPPVIFDDEKETYISALSAWNLHAPDALAEFMHHSRERYRDQILSSFDDGREFTYRFAEHADMEDFASQTRPADDIPGLDEPSHPDGFTR
jgi:hypothetical protein